MTHPSKSARRGMLFSIGMLVSLWAAVGDSPFVRRGSAQPPDVRSAMRKMQEEIHRLKVMLGFTDTTSIEHIQSAFKKEMGAHGTALSEDLRSYRGVMKSQVAEIAKLKQLNEDLNKEIQSIKRQLGRVEQTHRKHLDSGSLRANGAMQDLAKEREALNRNRERLAEENAKLQERFLDERKQMTAQREQLNVRLQECSKTIARLRAVMLKHGIDPKEAATTGTEPRTWSDTSGQFSVKAELVEVKDGKAMLRRADGKIIAVPVDKLSKADRDYLSSLNETAPPTESPKQPIERDSPEDDAARIRELIPAASAMARRDMDKLAKSQSVPKASDVEEKSLTLMLFTLAPKDTENAKHQFQYLTERIPKPSTIAGEIYRTTRVGGVALLKGPVTFIHADRITNFTCEVDGDTAPGSVSFKVPELCQGQVDYVARRKGDKWQMQEFIMSAYDIHLIRGTDGKWKEK